MKQFGRFIFIGVALFIILFVLLWNYCPASGLGLTKRRRELNQLKNRTALPSESDFDSRVMLQALLQPGDDRSRWSMSRAARIEGYAVSIASGPHEAANCYCRPDIHIMLAPRPDAPPREQIVMEVTPRIKATNQTQSPPPFAAPSSEASTPGVVPLQDWSVERLKRVIGRRVRFEGWLFFDSPHAAESENTAVGRANNWRASAWELHPITKIEILK